MDNYSLFTITRLGLFNLVIAIRGSNYYSRNNNVYYKVSFIEIIRIFVKDIVLSFNIVYKCKLFANNFWIFVFSFLVVVFIYKMYLKF